MSSGDDFLLKIGLLERLLTSFDDIDAIVRVIDSLRMKYSNPSYWKGHEKTIPSSQWRNLCRLISASLSSVGGVADFPSKVVEKLLLILIHFLILPECRIHFVAESGLSRLKQLMQKFAPDAAIQQNALAAVWNICVDPENQRAIGSAGFLTPIANSMDRFGSNKHIHRFALAALENISHCAENVNSVVSEGFLRRIATSIERFSSDEVIYRNALGVLVNLSDDSEAKKRIVEEGFLKQILFAMERFPKHEEIQRYSLWVLRSLSDREENRPLIAAVGVLRRVRKSIDDISWNGQLLVTSMALLLQLSKCDENRHFLLEGGFVPSISKTLKRFAEWPNIQMYGSGIFWSVSLDVKESERLQDEFLRRIGANMRYFRDEMFSQFISLDALHYLSDRSKESRKWILSGEFPQLIALAMERFPKELRIHCCALRLFRSLSELEENKKVLLSLPEGFASRVKTAVESFPQSEDIKKLAADILPCETPKVSEEASKKPST